MKKLKKSNYSRFFSLKTDINKIDLSDSDKVEIMLKKAKKYFVDHFLDEDE